MSKQDHLCAASGCPELREDPSAEFCINHERDIQDFERWLAGTDKVAWQAGSSFDSERRFLSVRQRPA
jgi:hypothetical protein